MDATGQALLDVEAALKQATAGIESMFDRAATLPDGRKTFRDQYGNVVDRDGNVIAEELADGIVWQGDEPTYEEYLAQRARIEKLQDARNELLGIEAELGGHQNDLTNNDEPPSPDRLDDIKDRADELRNRVSAIQSEFVREVENKTNLDTTTPEQGVELSEKSQTTLPTFGSSN